MAETDVRTLLEAFIEESKDGECSVHESAFIDPKVIPFLAEVRKACEQNLCGMYGKCWTCPPGVGAWEDLRDKYQSYAHALVYSTRHELEDSFDFEGMTDAREAHYKMDNKLRKSLRAAGADFAMLGAGGCSICPKCAYPDEPCRHPELATPSMESTGISVVELTKKIGIHYINGVNTVTYFSVIFCN